MDSTQLVSDHTQETVSQETKPDQEVPKQDETSEKKTVTWDNHRRALNDMHRYKNESKELRDRLSESEREKQELEEQKLREQENWKELAERRKEEAEKWKREAAENKERFYDTQKWNALKSAALKAGLLPDAVDDLDRLVPLEEVEIEVTDSGRYAVMNANEVIERFKERKPYLFQRDSAPNINGGGGGAPPKGESITIQAVMKSEKDVKAGLKTAQEHEALYKRYLIQTGRLPKGG